MKSDQTELEGLFLRFLLGEPLQKAEGLTGMDLHCFMLCSSIQSKDEALFAKVEVDYSARTVSKTDPWVHNNFLLFTFVIGALTFKRDYAWIRLALQKRSDTEVLSQRITESLSHYVDGQYRVTARLKHLDLLILGLLECREQMLGAYSYAHAELSLNESWRSHGDSFIRTTVQGAENRLLQALASDELGPSRDAIAFSAIFIKRVHRIATLFTWAVLIGVLVWLFYMWRTALSFKGFVNDLRTWGGLLGFSAVFVYKQIVKCLEKFIRWIFGYRPPVD